MGRKGAGRRGAERRRAEPAGGAFTAPRKALLAAAVVLALFADDRQVGKIGDGRQMTQTAVALATTGEVGLARGIQLAAVPREGGDSVMIYGLGMSLAQTPAALLAPALERAAGPGSSQCLFLVAPLLLGLLAAAAAGRVARLLGAGERGQAAAVLLASLASPLGSYATLDLSETLQAACLAWGLAASLSARRADTRAAGLRWAALAGACLGASILTKASLFGVAPFALLPLAAESAKPETASRRSRLGAAALAATPLIGAWFALEVVRFGGPFRGYGSFSFSYPFLLGAVRLLVGPNKGLLLFFPALAVALLEGIRRSRATGSPSGRTGLTPERLEALACLLPLGALLAMAAPWWAWHGVVGWGPRLLVPGIPGPAALAACAFERWGRERARLALGASIALNVFPLLQSPVPVALYTRALAPIAATPDLVRRYPGMAMTQPGGGEPQTLGSLVVHEVPLASDFVLYPWFLRVRSSADSQVRAKELESPPWIRSRPDLRPATLPYPVAKAEVLAPRLGFGFLGRSFVSPSDPANGGVYFQALSNQVFRAQQQRNLERALRLASRLFELRPEPDSAALLAECYRLMGRHETLSAFLDGLPPSIRATPPVFTVIALAARDVGEEEAARAYLERAARLGMPGTAALVSRPASSWPADFATIVASSGLDVEAKLSAFGSRAR